VNNPLSARVRNPPRHAGKILARGSIQYRTISAARLMGLLPRLPFPQCQFGRLLCHTRMRAPKKLNRTKNGFSAQAGANFKLSTDSMAPLKFFCGRLSTRQLSRKM
jgi:hypothetical protein